MIATVKIYSTTHCPYCIIAKNFFKQNNIEYEEINVEDDREAAMEMIQKSGQSGVPVIEIGTAIIVGFNKPAILKALEKMK